MSSESRILLARSAAFLTFVLATVVIHAADAEQTEKAYQAQIRPLVKKICVDCHSGAEPDGGMTLEHLETSKSLMKERRIWEKVIQRVKIGDMPPPESSTLSDKERAQFVSWLEVAINDIDCGRTPNPGRVTLRRLNRHEYRNTVRDLVGVDFTPAEGFPGDDVGYGFDNIGDVLTLPPLLMEKYVKAAEEIASQAITAPPPGANFEVSLTGSQLKPTGGAKAAGNQMTFFSNGSGEFGEQAPWLGTYRLEIDANSDPAGDEPARLLVTMEGKKVKELLVKAARNEEPETFVLQLKLKAGRRDFKLEFTNDYYKEPEGGKPRQDRNLYVHAVRLMSKQEPKPIDPAKLSASHKALVFEKPSAQVTSEQAARKVLGRLASRAYRRPVTPAELDRLVKLSEDIIEQGEPYEAGLQVALTALLVSPNFLFKVEQGGGGVAVEKYGRLSDYELATRLSYFLWSTMPDDRLLLLAFKKELNKPEVMAAEIKRMIADRRSTNYIENFAGQWLTLPKLTKLEPNKTQFPKWNEEIGDLMRRETLMFVNGVLREDLSILTLLDADFTYLNQQLAEYYGVKGVEGEQFRKVSTKGYPRMGILTQGSILAVTSNPTRTSPVKRGKWILDNILGEPPPPAPPNVPELEKTALVGTLRERLEQHRVNPACASCHKLMDPLGFALENFDAVGRWRLYDGKDKINPTGTLPSGAEVRDAGQLIRHLRQEQADKFARCLTEKMMTFALGRGLEYYDKCAVDKILSRLKASDYRFSTLITEIVMSDPFQRFGERETP